MAIGPPLRWPGLSHKNLGAFRHRLASGPNAQSRGQTRPASDPGLHIIDSVIAAGAKRLFSVGVIYTPDVPPLGIDDARGKYPRWRPIRLTAVRRGQFATTLAALAVD